MLQLIQVTSEAQAADVRPLFSGYIDWLAENLTIKPGIPVDKEELLKDFMQGLEIFYPPTGKLYLAKYNGEFAGVGCLKRYDENTGEIKRMFVDAKYRGKGVAKGILDQLIADARANGWKKILLDSPRASTSAHRLYESRGFQYIEPFPGSEGAESQDIIEDPFVFMKLVL